MKAQPLQLGDTIAILSPSSCLASIFPHRINKAKAQLEDMGFRVSLFPTTKLNHNGKAGTVEQRLEDIHNAFLDPKIKAILCSIGGLSANELIEKIDYKIIKNNPKIFVGYSDITLLHFAILQKTGLTTFYGPCAMTQFGEFPQILSYTKDYFLKALSSTTPVGLVCASKEWTDELLDWNKKLDLTRPRRLLKSDGHVWIKEGRAQAKVVGGCLYSLGQVRGSSFNPNYKEKILFIEIPEGQDYSKGEPIEYVDSQIMDLRNAGVFDEIKGLIVGRPFGYSKEDQDRFLEVIKHHTKKYDFPVICNVNIGHADPIITLPLNVEVLLDSSKNEFSIIENGVEN